MGNKKLFLGMLIIVFAIGLTVTSCHENFGNPVDLPPVVGKWTLYEIDGMSIPDGINATINFKYSGKVDISASIDVAKIIKETETEMEIDDILELINLDEMFEMLKYMGINASGINISNFIQRLNYQVEGYWEDQNKFWEFDSSYGNFIQIIPTGINSNIFNIVFTEIDKINIDFRQILPYEISNILNLAGIDIDSTYRDILSLFKQNSNGWIRAPQIKNILGYVIGLLEEVLPKLDFDFPAEDDNEFEEMIKMLKEFHRNFNEEMLKDFLADVMPFIPYEVNDGADGKYLSIFNGLAFRR